MLIDNLLNGKQHLAIGSIEPGYIYKLGYTDTITFFIRLLEEIPSDAQVIAPVENVLVKSYAIVNPYDGYQYIVNVPEAGGYVPVIDLNTGKIVVVKNSEYNKTLDELRDKKAPATIMAELNHEELVKYARRIGQIREIDIPNKNTIAGRIALAFTPVYKEESNIEVTYPLELPKDKSTKAYTLRTNPETLDLEWYYYNWFAISKEEQNEVLKWVSTNDWGFKLANKINRLG